MTEHEDLVAEAHEHLDKAADAAPVSARQAILTGKVEDQRLSLVARLVHALEKVTAERDAALRAMNDHECGEQAERAYRRAKKAEAERDELRRALQAADDSRIADWQKLEAECDEAWRVAAEQTRTERGRAEKAEAERDQLDAVVERAKGWATIRVPGFTVENQMAEVADALMGAPSVALDRVKAEALREAGRQHFKECVKNGVGDPTSGKDWMYQYANRIEKGESNV